jgi:SAM-dependent methyltransferase
MASETEIKALDPSAHLRGPTAPGGDKPPGGGFDAADERYDSDERGNRVLTHMRSRSLQEFCRAFDPGAKLLELGSGTGTEAARLAREHGCRVALADLSPRLLERAKGKVLSVSRDSLLGSHLMAANSIGELTSVYGRGFFDGAFSSFGPLNCEPRLDVVAEGLAALVRPGGTLVLSIINRWCPAEVAWFALHGQLREASRRWGGPVQAAAYPGGPKDVTTWYYSRGAIARAFSGHFRVEHAEALPLLWPPPYLDFLVARFEGLFRALERLEPWAARQAILRDLGDHVLLRLRRN